MIKNCSIEVNDHALYAETGRIAKQASGSVVVTFGDTVVLVTAVSTDEIREGIDFLLHPWALVKDLETAELVVKAVNSSQQ